MSINGFQDGHFATTFLASFLIWFLLLALIPLFVAGKLKRRDIVLALLAGAVAWLLAQSIKYLVPFAPRPFKVNGFPPLTFTVPSDASFPSGHTALAFSVGVYLWLKNKKWGLIFVIGGAFVGLGRIFSNVHFPIDVLGGAILGTFVAPLFESFANGKRNLPRFNRG